jgi:hypothetical protein
MKKTYKNICAWAEKTFRPSVEKFWNGIILPPPPKGMEEERAKAMDSFHENVTKPIFALAFGLCFIAVVLDYTFQLIDAIDILTL